ncbi:heavy metal-associated isoprenylated plant protein 47 [Coffea arabica]|uniref:Heavy metal-associated isoprenylated plant protein 47 n=1 Tax=Coffea arabica TaxID=13443 RepID=A0A6P6W286_COFAR
MQQRIVIRVLDCAKKKQLSRAMQITVSVAGIERVALQGENKDQIVVVGEGIDAVNLTSLLRKKLGSVELVSVIPIGELGNREEEEEEYTYGTTSIQPTVYPTYPVWTYPTY